MSTRFEQLGVALHSTVGACTLALLLSALKIDSSLLSSLASFAVEPGTLVQLELLSITQLNFQAPCSYC